MCMVCKNYALSEPTYAEDSFGSVVYMSCRNTDSLFRAGLAEDETLGIEELPPAESIRDWEVIHYAVVAAGELGLTAILEDRYGYGATADPWQFPDPAEAWQKMTFRRSL